MDKNIGLYLSLSAIVMSGHLLIPSAVRARDRMIARFAPQDWLYKYSLWDECDGEPMNGWADELMRRDELAAKQVAPTKGEEANG